ncbi:Methyltransferase type 11 [Hyella patelloides LEGE 07179]|uniref:Methyltransferase type 11 n=1 Tax=Hyella patelloides LEGE 07179 TaxID=945734 RepID=A0A563W2R3_9CYAN|nr:class I SAM-dependent methyltransferase [Hyella patelloides]VEP17940.1 Methyltransferase type 11 [Hyella patelloides LEGE 07179]
METLPKLYTELADWWYILSSPEDYAEEAEFYRQAIISACELNPLTLLELGSGGGNNASHLKQHFEMTLVDISPEMLAISRELNPECEHIEGDMRTVRLNRQYDAVFIHDAIDYMQSASDLRSAIATAYSHCKPGGVALFAPDHTLESFQPGTTHGGCDLNNRSLRYLEWTWDREPNENTYISVMVYVMRERDKLVRCVEERHVFGLFSKNDWQRFVTEVGFKPQSIPFKHSSFEGDSRDVFLGLKQRESGKMTSK